jgi:subtilisin family serine protease
MAPNTYDAYSGTSMATPHVTGAIALFASKCPVATMTWMRAALLAGGTATSSLAGKSVTGMRLNVGGLLTGNCS